MDGELAKSANESIVNALGISSESDLTQLATKATSSFNESLVTTALISSALMIVVSVVVYLLMPKSFDITE